MEISIHTDAFKYTHESADKLRGTNLNNCAATIGNNTTTTADNYAKTAHFI